MTGSPIKTLFPGYFALVMATGIIAVGCQQQGLHLLARGYFWIAVAAYAALTAALLVRIVRYPKAVVADATHHANGFTFLTVVAGTNVLGAASAIVQDWWVLAWCLWWLSLPLWVLWLYTALIAEVIRGDKPGLRRGINGGWFMLTVSTESIAVLSALLLTRSTDDLLAVFSVAAFLLGLILYVIVMTMVFMRWSLRVLDPTEIDPAEWIAAGAVAITALAGSNLAAAAPDNPRLEQLMPLLEGVSLMAWATAAFWFPLILALDVWRHFGHRVPMSYHPAYWSVVFPIGMYAVASDQLFQVFSIHGLGWLPEVNLALAVASWLVIAVGLLKGLLGSRWSRAAG